MKTKNNDISHCGHRKRLTDLVCKAGIENLSEIQQVEYFLFLIIPRVDVNPLAHRLLKRYGNFGNIIDADLTDLMNVEGIGELAAKKIKSFAGLRDLYVTSKMTGKLNLKNRGEFLDYLEQLLRFRQTENLFLFAMSNNYKITAHRVYDLKLIREVGLPILEICGFIASTKPAFLILAHNHPDGTALPSEDDNDSVGKIKKLLESFECKFYDSFIVGCDGIFGEKQNAFLRHFDDKGFLFEFLK